MKYLLITLLFIINKDISLATKAVEKCVKVCKVDSVLPAIEKGNVATQEFYAFKDNHVWTLMLNKTSKKMESSSVKKIASLFPYFPNDGHVETAFSINEKFYYLIYNHRYYRYDIDANYDFVYQDKLMQINNTDHSYLNAIGMVNTSLNRNISNNLFEDDVLLKDKFGYYQCHFSLKERFNAEEINCKQVQYNEQVNKTLNKLNNYTTYTNLKNGQFIGLTDHLIVFKEKLIIDEKLNSIENDQINFTLCLYDYFCKEFGLIPDKVPDDVEYGQVIKFNSSPIWLTIFLLMTIILVIMLSKIFIDLIKEKPTLPIIRRSYKRLPVDRHPFIIS